MSSSARIAELASELRDWPIPLQINVRSVPSGLTYLDVGIGERWFILAYYPKENGFGVDEVLEHDGFEMGYKYWFDEFEPAKERLLSMLRDSE
jgi:hypothetical protein